MILDLFPHQQDAAYRVAKEFEDHGRKSAIVVMATGTGKTRVAACMARWCVDERGGRCLFLAHTEHLIVQAENEMCGQGLDPAVEQAARFARARGDDPNLVVGSVQTMKGDRLESWPEDYFDLVIVDEAHHHIPGSAYESICSYFRPRWLLGLSATPKRLDGVDLGTVFESVAFEYSLREAVEQNRLAPIRVRRLRTSVDLADIRTTRKNDFSRAQLQARILPHVGQLANSAVEEVGARRTIVFTPDVGSAQGFASALRSLGRTAEWVAGARKDKADVLASFGYGKFQYLVNAQLATEGVDFPACSCVVLARPTQSEARFIQMIGRATRKFPGKDFAFIIDYAWLSATHRLVQPAVLMERPGEPMPYLARRRVERALDAGEEVDLLEAVERGERAARELPEITLDVKPRSVHYRRYTYDPIAALARALDDGDDLLREGDAAVQERATPKQAERLEKWGIKNARSLSRRRANQLMAAAVARFKLRNDRGEPMSSLGQVQFLIRLGADPRIASAMSRAEASAEIDRRKRRRVG